MSQPPPWDQGQPSHQNQPDQDQPPSWPSGAQPPAWPSGDQPQGSQSPGAQPPSWPSAGPGAGWQPSWPAPGQSSPPPPSWPGGGADQPPPPPGAWPPAGQPPFPSPGYTYGYGYGPRPPRRRWRPRFLGAIITLGVIIVLGAVVGNIGKSHGTVSVTPFPSGASASAGHQVRPGRIGSSFELDDGSGNVYRVTLVKMIDPARGENQFATPDTGKRFVGLVFKVKALTGSPKDEDANNDAVVIGGNGQNYSADFDGIAGYTDFDQGVIHVAQGETVTGSVTFQLPNAVAVSTVQWTALSGFGSTVEWIVHG